MNQVRQQATPTELGGKLSHALADRPRITGGEAARRIHEAQDLGARRPHRRTTATAAGRHRRWATRRGSRR
ncbi:MAG TPA: DUF222 domain-containing protein [Mycobacterium sp.]|nr:DUF222 domain-containing protein [Mycobacterium sp.]